MIRMSSFLGLAIKVSQVMLNKYVERQFHGGWEDLIIFDGYLSALRPVRSKVETTPWEARDLIKPELHPHLVFLL